MTDREALEIMSDCRYCNTKKFREDGEMECLGNVYCFFTRATAISALKEREERGKGCEYCLEYADLPEHFKCGKPIGKVFDTSITQDENEWHIEAPYSADIGIRYCPICGREL